MPRPTPADFDRVDQKVLDDIKKHGWSDMAIFAGENTPPFNYTVGLDGFEHPELVCIGLHPEQGHGVLGSAIELIKAGTRLNANEYYEEVLEGFPVAFVEVDDMIGSDFPMSMTYRLSDSKVALQLVWPDMNGHFPWHGDFNEELRWQQPLLGTWRGVDA